MTVCPWGCDSKPFGFDLGPACHWVVTQGPLDKLWAMTWALWVVTSGYWGCDLGHLGGDLEILGRLLGALWAATQDL